MLTLLCWWSIAFGIEVTAVPNPRDSGLWVVDVADILSEEREIAINAQIEQLHRDSDVEIALVTVSNVSVEPKDFATDLFNHWGIGGKEKDTGLLVILVMGKRRLEMETGYGMEAILSDGWLGGMQQEKMVPHFKKGDFGEGLAEGILAIDVAIRNQMGLQQDEVTEWVTVKTTNDDPPPKEVSEGKEEGTEELSVMDGIIGLFGLEMMFGLALFVFGVVWLYKRQRQCPTCKIQMVKLSEEADDAHLDTGQRMEESLKSIDYHVYQCSHCGFRKTFTRSKWGSGYKKCSSCNYKTSAPLPENKVNG